MTTANDVAKYFLTLADPDQGEIVSHLKLQKLCYYAQGFALAVLGRPLFADEIKAWEHGPVVPSVWRPYSKHHAAAIPAPEHFDPAVLGDAERELLDEVWDAYGQFSAWKLRNMTHDEPPWKDTMRGCTISLDAMRAYFSTLTE